MSQQLIEERLLIHNAERCDPPLQREEVEGIARSIAKYPVGNASRQPERVEREHPDTPDDSWPRPLQGLAFHGVFGELVRAIEPSTEADPAALLIQALAMFGNVIGRTAHWRVEADIHHLNLNVVLVGATGKGRKGTSGSHVRAVFAQVDPSWSSSQISSGLSSGEGLIWTVRDQIDRREPVRKSGHVTGYQTVIVDHGISDKRLLVVEAEFSSTLRVIGRDGNTLSPIIRQAWDGQDLRSLTKNSPAVATGAHISIIGHITADELRRDLDRTESANGFGNRFLWVCVRRSKELPDGGASVDTAPYIERIRAAVDFARSQGQLQRDSSARELWHQIYGQLSAGRPGLLGSMTARAEAQVMRLACLFAVADQSTVIGAQHLRAALELWRYCQDSAANIFGDRLGDPVADEIRRALKQAGAAGLTRSEILHGVFERNRSAAQVGRALQLLEQAKLARRQLDPSNGGRPAERWFAINDINDIDDKSLKQPAEMSSTSSLS